MNWDDYAVIPYLKRPEGDDNRAVPVFPLWDGQRWRHWISTPKMLIELQIVDLAEGAYVAKQPRHASDLMVPFLDFTWKHASWRDVAHWLAAIEMDMFRLAASLAKVDHFASCSAAEGRDTAMFVSTEIEYLLGRSRSLFDNLQLAINGLWDRILLLDPDAQKVKKQQKPPESFSDAAKKITKRAAGEAPYAMPQRLLLFYDNVSAFFFALKDVRDKIVHRAAGMGAIFVLDRGYGICKDSPLVKLGPELTKDHYYNENVVALAPILANVVCSSIYACNDFAEAFASIFRLPPTLIDDGHHVFIRAPHAPSLTNAQEILRGKTPWRTEAATQGTSVAATIDASAGPGEDAAPIVVPNVVETLPQTTVVQAPQDER